MATLTQTLRKIKLLNFFTFKRLVFVGGALRALRDALFVPARRGIKNGKVCAGCSYLQLNFIRYHSKI
ncbi:MAG: hypothetical protein HYY55_04375 [Candidatus Niyogibacteria bacterium]|nr:MAG: hypothetical protein HYY55_04375 [Candidatus Niyogibacteria bacterium]